MDRHAARARIRGFLPHRQRDRSSQVHGRRGGRVEVHGQPIAGPVEHHFRQFRDDAPTDLPAYFNASDAY